MCTDTVLHSKLGLHTGSWNFRHFLFTKLNSEPRGPARKSAIKFYMWVKMIILEYSTGHLEERPQMITKRVGSNRPVFCVGLICHQLTKSNRA